MIGLPAWARRLQDLLLTSAAALYAVPLYLMVTLSVKTDLEAAFRPFALPSSFRVENYTAAWRASAVSSNASLAPAMLNSLLVTVLSIAGLVLSGALAGYVLARRRERVAEWIFVLFLVGMTVPQQLGLVPLFQLIRDLGLVGSPMGLVLINLGVLAPLTVFLYTSFIRGLPPEYEEAALMDGASHLRIFWHVVLPLVRPVTATVVVIHGVHVWNDFFTPLIFLLGSGAETLPVAIFSLVGEYSTDWGPIFAGTVIASAPALLVFVFLQRHIVRGFSGGLK
jgi:raffinose/stachyose/melibiose transport system permease protein